MICPQCGAELVTGQHCVYHQEMGDRWADNNRAICDLVHRRIARPRLSLGERDPLIAIETDWQAP